MRKNICILLFFLINIAISANDGRIVIGPSIEILDNENTNIKMQSEVINIIIHDEYYEISVEFDFYNEGSAETILVGFPVESWTFTDDDYIRENIFDFKSYINGELISEYNIIEEEENIQGYFIIKKKWYIREVLFPEKSHTYSTVTYSVKNQYSFGGALVGYIFGTGRSWKDKIGKMTVYITHDDNIIISSISNIDTFDFTWEANGKYKFEIENIKPELHDRIYINIRRLDDFIDSLHYVHHRTGKSLLHSLLHISENDIQYWTINQVRLLINSYFKNQEYELDEIDIINIDYLLKFENTIPDNIHENYIELPHEIEMFQAFSEKQGIKWEANNEEIDSELIQNIIEKKSVSIWTMFMIFGGCTSVVSLLIYVLRKLKNKQKIV